MSIYPSNVFNYHDLKKKAHREINRLIKAEEDIDEEAAIDFALNAAITIFHLLEWRDKNINPNSKTKARDLCEKSNSEALKLLHDIATHTKHVKVSNPASSQNDHNPQGGVNEGCLSINSTDGEGLLLINDGDSLGFLEIRTPTGKIYFGDKLAVDVLQEAMSEFE